MAIVGSTGEGNVHFAFIDGLTGAYNTPAASLASKSITLVSKTPNAG